MNRLFKILDGICAEKDYRDQNINNLDSIVLYAEACNEDISFSEAEKIQKAGKDWLKKQENGGEWSRYRGEAIAACSSEEEENI